MALKTLIEISLYISEMKSAVRKIKDGMVLESTKVFYYTDGVKRIRTIFIYGGFQTVGPTSISPKTIVRWRIIQIEIIRGLALGFGKFQRSKVGKGKKISNSMVAS